MLPALEALEEVLDFRDIDFERFFLGFGRLTGALGGSKLSSMTKTTPSSVSELLVFVVGGGVLLLFADCEGIGSTGFSTASSCSLIVGCSSLQEIAI